MLNKKFLATCAITAGLFSLAVSDANANANTAATAKYLEHGGSFYMVSDAQAVRPQMQYILKSMISRFKPATAQKLEAINTMSEMAITLAGFYDIRAIGQSSKLLLAANNNQPAIYHNRLVMTIAPDKEIPLFLQLFSGADMQMQTVAKLIPDNAQSACSGSINPMQVYTAIDSMGLIPAEIKAEATKNLGCSLEDILKAVTGKYFVCLLKVNANKFPNIVMAISDQKNLIFGMICKSEGKDPAKEKFIECKDEGPDAGYIKFVKSDNALLVYIGAETEAMYTQKLKSGQTIDKSPMFRALTAKIPAVANSYYFDCMNFGKKGLAGVSAAVIDKSGMKYYNNSYYDWNMLPVAMIFKFTDEVLSVANLYNEELPIPAIQ